MGRLAARCVGGRASCLNPRKYTRQMGTSLNESDLELVTLGVSVNRLPSLPIQITSSGNVVEITPHTVRFSLPVCCELY